MRKVIVIGIHLIIFCVFFIFSYDNMFWDMLESIKSSDQSFNIYVFEPFILVNLLSLIEFIPNFYIGYLVIPLTLSSKRKYIWISIIIVWCIFALLLPAIYSEKAMPISKYIDDIIFVLIGFGTRLSLDYLFQKIDNNKLEKENLRAQLENLKNQINPHFLFNTLHNIEGLIDSKPEKASLMIIKLSEILRFLVYESNQEFIELSKEISALNNLIELHKIRFDKNIVEFEYDKKILNIQFPPLILMTIAENAFKHYAENKFQSKIIFKVFIEENKIIIHSSNPFKPKETKKGIGMLNLTKRLDIIYNKSYKLDISDENEIYQLKLEITL